MAANNESWHLADVAIGMAIFCSATYSRAEDKVVVQTARVNAFFGGSLSSELEELKPYAGSPDERAGLPARDHGRVVKEFDTWIRRAMKPQYVPDEAFVERNILLIPAKNTNGKDDVAFLSYEIAGKTFRVVQTGGGDPRARIWIFVHDPASGELQTAGDAADRLGRLLGAYVSTKFRKLVPGFTFRKVPAAFVGEVKSPSSPTKVSAAECFLSDKDSCLVMYKDFPGMGVPQQTPELNGWFSWGEKPRIAVGGGKGDKDDGPPAGTERSPEERAFLDRDPTKPTAPPLVGPPK